MYKYACLNVITRRGQISFQMTISGRRIFRKRTRPKSLPTEPLQRGAFKQETRLLQTKKIAHSLILVKQTLMLIIIHSTQC